MSVTALFLTAPTWKQPRYPSVAECLNKQWYIQTMDYYSALKRNDLSSHKKTWKKLKCILLSERSQSEKVPCYMIPTIQDSEKNKTMEIVKRSVVAKG